MTCRRAGVWLPGVWLPGVRGATGKSRLDLVDGGGRPRAGRAEKRGGRPPWSAGEAMRAAAPAAAERDLDPNAGEGEI